MSHEEALRRIDEARRTKATTLSLSGCDIDTLPPELAELTWLEELRVDGHEYWEQQQFSPNRGRLATLPDWIGCFEQLRVLKVRSQQLQTLPPELGNLTQLQWLDVSNNHLNSLPSELEQLTQLQTLDVINNQLTRLLPELGQLTQLHTLDMSFNQLTSLPSELGQLTQLHTLDVSDNPLDIPTELIPEWDESPSRLLAYLRQRGKMGRGA